MIDYISCKDTFVFRILSIDFCISELLFLEVTKNRDGPAGTIIFEQDLKNNTIKQME